MLCYKPAFTSRKYSFLSLLAKKPSRVISKDEKLFWLKFRRKLEILNEKTFLFQLGQVFLTIGAKEALAESGQTANEFLDRPQLGDWGDVCEDDRRENELSIKEGFRILSAYKTSKGEKIWIITERCRTLTTLLLPEEY